MSKNLKDETGNVYGKWTVVKRTNSSLSMAAWLCRCECGCERSIFGVELRRRRSPLCTNCCRVCGRTRGETEFKGNKRTCYECHKRQVREWKKGSKTYRTKVDSWLKKNPEAVERHRRNARIQAQSSPEKFLRATFRDRCRKFRALSRNLDPRTQQKAKSPERHLITITLEQVLALWNQQDGKCAISGMQMAYKFNNPCSVSLDRIDSANGYLPENTQLVCRWVNLAKNNFSDKKIRQVLQEFKTI